MKILLLIILFLLTNIVRAQNYKISSLQFLRISPSPRASALGNAYTSIIGNSDSLFYNPGALAFFKLTTPKPLNPEQNLQSPLLRNMSFSIFYANLFSDINTIAFSSMFDLKKIGVIGLGFTTMPYPDMTVMARILS